MGAAPAPDSRAVGAARDPLLKAFDARPVGVGGAGRAGRTATRAGS